MQSKSYQQVKYRDLCACIGAHAYVCRHGTMQYKVELNAWMRVQTIKVIDVQVGVSHCGLCGLSANVMVTFSVSLSLILQYGDLNCVRINCIKP